MNTADMAIHWYREWLENSTWRHHSRYPTRWCPMQARMHAAEEVLDQLGFTPEEVEALLKRREKATEELENWLAGL